MSLISKQIDELRAYAKDRKGELAKLINDAADTIEELSSKLHASQMERSSQYYHDGWIPYNEKLPEDGQRILISVTLDGHEPVQLTECMTDGNGYYTDAGYEWGSEISAWMPLPEPYKPKEKNDACD